MAARRLGPFKLNDPWVRIGWLSPAGLLAVGMLLGFVVLSRQQQNGPPLGPWSAVCSALGISPDVGPADEPQPPLRTGDIWLGGSSYALPGTVRQERCSRTTCSPLVTWRRKVTLRYKLVLFGYPLVRLSHTLNTILVLIAFRRQKLSDLISARRAFGTVVYQLTDLKL